MPRLNVDTATMAQHRVVNGGRMNADAGHGLLSIRS